jgi:hypothetical protein
VDASNAEPVGLFFAGGSDNNGNGYSVANPIQDVLGELGTQAGQPLKIVGGAQHPVACLNYDGNEPSASTSVPEEWMRKAETAAHDASESLVSAANGILGAAAGRSADDAGEPAVIVYVDRSRGSVSVPQTFEGIRTQVIATDDNSVSNGTAPKSAGMFPGIHLPQETLWSAGAMAELPRAAADGRSGELGCGFDLVLRRGRRGRVAGAVRAGADRAGGLGDARRAAGAIRLSASLSCDAVEGGGIVAPFGVLAAGGRGRAETTAGVGVRG